MHRIRVGEAFKGDAKRPGRNFSDKPARPAGARVIRPGRDEFGSEAKTYGKPRTRPDGKPHPKRTGAAPQRGPKPGGRPSGGAGRPGGPRKPRA